MDVMKVRNEKMRPKSIESQIKSRSGLKFKGVNTIAKPQNVIEAPISSPQTIPLLFFLIANK